MPTLSFSYPDDIRRIGTLGILRRAQKASLISEIRPYAEQRQANGVYIRTQLIEAILRDVGELE